ncbi:uncharacterized protein BDZ99DRAFT_233986 [Mytilinidion resinicola]|uniref:Uncharacterized protein n=1 Tax=Mytilinidion resinicola TaxID=574789 RepID=A0A6A6YZ96_9PEZI|nr:uncharacterized protein BDZ99DRAFT_233986 [Mytilinidion resinicola]KAF2814242.1 hypothetical protein BDZ99DRAFT_233986 [Mytilinidion resinicola]
MQRRLSSILILMTWCLELKYPFLPVLVITHTILMIYRVEFLRKGGGRVGLQPRRELAGIVTMT